MLKNPLLAQAMQSLEQGVKDRDAFGRIVTAGTKMIYDERTFPELVKGLEESDDPVQTVAEGIIGVLGLMAKKSRGTMPKVPMVQAGLALLLDALDFLEQAGKAEITKEVLAKAVTGYINSLLPKFGVTPDKMDAMLAGVQPTLNDPQRMAEYKQSQGAPA